MDEAREAIGPEFAENPIVWSSKDNIIVTYPISFGKIMNVVAIQARVDK